MTVQLKGEDFPTTIINVGHSDEIIEELMEKRPLDKRTDEYKTWKNNMNILVSASNTLCGFKRYSVIK